MTAHAGVLEFMQKADQDADLGARVRAIKVDDKDQALAALARIAKEAGYDLSPTALEAGLRERSSGELSDANLDAVSGGGTDAGWAPQTSAFSSFFSFGFSTPGTFSAG
jgi:predicted ribosomally synthesized peptide with nif11-like leader